MEILYPKPKVKSPVSFLVGKHSLSPMAQPFEGLDGLIEKQEEK